MKHDAVQLPLGPEGEATERPISVAIVAMGGQGGGVLTDWIRALAEAAGWAAQATSVPGVAQRTGATIYYVEMMRLGPDGRRPILAQMPTPGDVDVVIASEYMEAGRSILRGLSTPDRTVLIASNHRALATVEKIAPGEGIADSAAVSDAIGVAAQREIRFDMQRLAAESGSVISAALFGALAASERLPFPRTAFEDVIRAGDKGVAGSLRAFDAAFAEASAPTPPAPAAAPKTAWRAPERLRDDRANALLNRIKTELPAPSQEIAYLGLQKLVEFQDAAYGAEYLDQLRDIAAGDAAERGWAFTTAAAKHLANAMAYDDVIRVAALKTRAARRARVAAELGVTPSQVLSTTEYFHPRIEEVASILPGRWARGLMARKGLYAWLGRRIDKGRRVRTYAPHWFLTLYVLGGLSRLRRGSLRDETERAHREGWLTAAVAARAENYDLGVEILNFRRLIKGYSDTHKRGLNKFDQVMAATQLVAGRDDAADWARRLLKAAIRDASGEELAGAIKTIESFA